MPASSRSAGTASVAIHSSPPGGSPPRNGARQAVSHASAFPLRLACCYLPIYVLCCGNVTLWRLLPGVGARLEYRASLLLLLPARWIALHFLHLPGAAVALDRGSSGDRALDWLAAVLLLAAATVAALVWTRIVWTRRDGRRSQAEAGESRLRSPLDLLLRLALAASLLQYGWVKVFPLQMPAPSLAVLNEPLGAVSPMSLLWALVGVSPGYEACCGLTEVLAGLLVLFRRTQTAGALLTLVVMSQVMLYNVFLDVPLKLYTGHLLLIAAILLWPSRQALANVLWRGSQPGRHPGHQRPAGLPLPGAATYPRLERTAQAALLLVLGLVLPWQVRGTWAAQRAAERHPSPLSGEWNVEGPDSVFFPLPNGSPLVQITLESTGRVNLRSADGELWRSPPGLAADGHTLTLAPYTGAPRRFAVTQLDAQHLRLTLVAGPSVPGCSAAACPELRLTRVPLPAHYPLLERGFHWVNDWGYER